MMSSLRSHGHPRRAPRRATVLLTAWTLASIGWAGSARAIEPPPRPGVPSVEREGTSVRLRWAATAGATRYEVYRGTRRIGASEGLSFFDEAAPAADAFYFVTACRSWACSPGSPGIIASAAVAPACPSPAATASAETAANESALAGLSRAVRSAKAALAACEIDRTELRLERDELRMEVGGLLAKAAEPAEEPSGTAETFACLDTATDVVPALGSHAHKYRVDGSPGRAWDARGFDAFTDHIRHGAVVMRDAAGSPGMCWAGGYVRSTRPVNASWAEHKAADDPDDPSRNTTAIETASSSGTVTGMHVENVGDAFRNYKTQNWLVQHSWAEYVRDDGIENDDLRHGRVHDVLFDGVYSGFSARPSKANHRAAANGSVVTLERVLLRMEAQPYPYEWERKGGNIDAAGKPWRKGEGIPYGHGNLFKIEDHDIPGRNVRWALRDSTFMATHRVGDPRKLNLPPGALLDECTGVTVIWTGGGDYPGALPNERFPDCVTVVTGEEGVALWASLVRDWHERHPQVGAARKPLEPWRLEWPRSTVGDE